LPKRDVLAIPELASCDHLRGAIDDRSSRPSPTSLP
jgi:hypothetical protein